MKKIIIVNNNMNLGGVQKALLDLLWAVQEEYDITLFLFSSTGEYMDKLPQKIKVVSCKSMFQCLGISQNESKSNPVLFLIRGLLAFLTKKWGKQTAMKLILMSQPVLTEKYDCAVSYLQNGGTHSFYGGCNEFVLQKIHADRKITFLHCDYRNCGANNLYNNVMYDQFDGIAACSEGCRKAFLEIFPEKENITMAVTNCHDYDRMIRMSQESPEVYDEDVTNIITVARLSAEKGIERGIGAVAEAVKRGYKACYHIVGDGIEREKLENLVKTLEIEHCVKFYGGTDNPYRYMKNADLLMVTSFHEAAPLVIDEALCLGVPVLSTETTSSQDMVLDRGIGWVCKNDQQSLNKMLVQILEKSEILGQVKERISSMECSNKQAVYEFRKVIEN